MSEDAARQDRADMARLVRGQDAALNDLMERHAGRLQACLFRLLQNHEDAEDLAQETFVRVFEHRHRFDPAHAFTTWLYTIATRLARDRFRWRSRHPEVALDRGADADGMADSPGAGRGWLSIVPSPGSTPDEARMETERGDAVRRAIAKLPEELRSPLILFEYEGQSHGAIARSLGCSAKAVEMRLYRARQRLRTDLARWLEP